MAKRPPRPKPTLVPFTRTDAPKPLWEDSRHVVTDFLKELDEGKINPHGVMIFFLDGPYEQGARPVIWRFHITLAEHIALCELAKMKALEEWRGE